MAASRFRAFLVLLGASVIGMGGPAMATERPVVLELFTSEGCSSCPPADALLGQLSTQPGVLALAYHVDYWNYLGWADPFSSSDHTNRQRGYARAMGLRSVYTPQLVVDGTRDLVGSDEGAVRAAIAKPRDGIPITASLESGSMEVSIGAAANAGSAEVTAVSYRSRAETKVARGENSGRSLTEYSIVRSSHPLGRWNGAQASYKLALNDIPADADHVAILMQQPGQGAILGATVMAVRSK